MNYIEEPMTLPFTYLFFKIKKIKTAPRSLQIKDIILVMPASFDLLYFETKDNFDEVKCKIGILLGIFFKVILNTRVSGLRPDPENPTHQSIFTSYELSFLSKRATSSTCLRVSVF